VCATHPEGESDDARKIIDSGSTSPRVPAEYARGGLSVSEAVERCCTWSVWFVVCGVWCVVCGVWCVVCGV